MFVQHLSYVSFLKDSFKDWGRLNPVFALSCPLCFHIGHPIKFTLSFVWIFYILLYILGVCVGLLNLCLAHGWLTFVWPCRVEDLAMGVCMEPWRISIRPKGSVACSVGSRPRCCGMRPSLASTWCSTHRPKTSHLRVRLNVGMENMPLLWCCPAAGSLHALLIALHLRS